MDQVNYSSPRTAPVYVAGRKESGQPSLLSRLDEDGEVRREDILDEADLSGMMMNPPGIKEDHAFRVSGGVAGSRETTKRGKGKKGKSR